MHVNTEVSTSWYCATERDSATTTHKRYYYVVSLCVCVCV